MPWYTVDNVADVPSPALLVYPERVAQNIRAALEIVGDARRLRPHLKTSKMGEVVGMHLDAGVTRFKCATIAEAEMAARAGAPDVLLAYQPVGPNIARFVRLVQAFPATRFAAIVDDAATVDALSAAAIAAGVGLDLFLDLDGGMRRSGIAPGPGALELYRRLSTRPGLRAAGLHMYDGHVRGPDVDARRLVQPVQPRAGPVERFEQRIGEPLRELVEGHPAVAEALAAHRLVAPAVAQRHRPDGVAGRPDG